MNQIAAYTLEKVAAEYELILRDIHDHEESEPIGDYDKEDRYAWSFAFHTLYEHKRIVEKRFVMLLDEQLDEYFAKAPWDKTSACQMLMTLV